MKNILYIPLTLLVFAGCSDFLEPRQDATMDEETVFRNVAYFTGPLMEAYSQVPSLYDIDLDKMTDNAVDNDFEGPYYLCGTGALRPNNYPLNNWTESYRQIRQLNIFLSKMVLDESKSYLTPIRFVALGTPQAQQDNMDMFWRLRGEAFFMRAYFQADLLRRFGGESADGRVLGVPIVGDRVLTVDDELDLPRASYDDCVEAIRIDCDSAIKLLPLEYNGAREVNSGANNGRAAGVSAMALKARVLLYAASPAFNKANDVLKWEKAAKAAGDLIVATGGLLDLSSIDDFYFAKLNNNAYQNRDILFRSVILTGNQRNERDQYPKGMYGGASTNVTQNFVDAFPDSQGYPIGESSQYNEGNPYMNRDPRLHLYVGVNGSQLGPDNYYTIESHQGGKDGYDLLKQTSRSSYYLKKTLNHKSVTLVSGSATSTSRTFIHLGMPEVYLTFAEAANEAWGPDATPVFTFSAGDVLRKIQQRYGCGSAYLDDVIGDDPDLFRRYIRNERRLELSFEGHYFFDLRRWIPDNGTESLNQSVYGMSIAKNPDNSLTYSRVFLEKRIFTSPYPPIPYKEVFNSEQVVQNYGW